MIIPGLGKVTKDKHGEYQSKPIPVPVLGGRKCVFSVEDYDEDHDKMAFHTAITNFLRLKKTGLRAAEAYVFQYYKDSEEAWRSCGAKFKAICSSSKVWDHVRLGSRPSVSRRPRGDKGIYISLECSCDWEQEHGMQMVFRNGLVVSKIGPFDGHLTNSDAYADESLENVIYRA